MIVITLIIYQYRENTWICMLDHALLDINLITPTVKLDHNFTATLLVYGCTYLTDVCLLHFSTSLFHTLL